MATIFLSRFSYPEEERKTINCNRDSELIRVLLNIRTSDWDEIEVKVDGKLVYQYIA